MSWLSSYIGLLFLCCVFLGYVPAVDFQDIEQAAADCLKTSVVFLLEGQTSQLRYDSSIKKILAATTLAQRQKFALRLHALHVQRGDGHVSNRVQIVKVNQTQGYDDPPTSEDIYAMVKTFLVKVRRWCNLVRVVKSILLHQLEEILGKFLKIAEPSGKLFKHSSRMEMSCLTLIRRLRDEVFLLRYGNHILHT